MTEIRAVFPESQDVTKDGQKKSKRKGRNKQDVLTVSPAEPEPEAVKTPIDLMRVRKHQPSTFVLQSLISNFTLLILIVLVKQ